MKNLILLKWMDAEGKKQKLRIIDEVSPKWREASSLLGLTPAHTQRIEMNYPRVEDRCHEVFHVWLSNEEEDTSYPSTWEGLIELLEDMELSALAKEIQTVVIKS